MQLNTRLLAKMQGVGGARVHEANGYMQRYMAWVYISNSSKHTEKEKKAAEKLARAVEVEMRKFLTQE